MSGLTKHNAIYLPYKKKSVENRKNIHIKKMYFCTAFLLLVYMTIAEFIQWIWFGSFMLLKLSNQSKFGLKADFTLNQNFILNFFI